MGGNARTRREVSTSGTRRSRGRLRYSDLEWAVIVAAAAVDGISPGAWVQQAGYEAAVRENRGGSDRRALIEAITAFTAEMREHRRVLTHIGGILNNIAHVGNANGESDAAQAAEAVLRVVAGMVRSSDTLLTDIRSRVVP